MLKTEPRLLIFLPAQRRPRFMTAAVFPGFEVRTRHQLSRCRRHISPKYLHRVGPYALAIPQWRATQNTVASALLAFTRCHAGAPKLKARLRQIMIPIIQPSDW